MLWFIWKAKKNEVAQKLMDFFFFKSAGECADKEGNRSLLILGLLFCPLYLSLLLPCCSDVIHLVYLK